MILLMESKILAAFGRKHLKKSLNRSLERFEKVFFLICPLLSLATVLKEAKPKNPPRIYVKILIYKTEIGRAMWICYVLSLCSISPFQFTYFLFLFFSGIKLKLLSAHFIIDIIYWDELVFLSHGINFLLMVPKSVILNRRAKNILGVNTSNNNQFHFCWTVPLIPSVPPFPLLFRNISCIHVFFRSLLNLVTSWNEYFELGSSQSGRRGKQAYPQIWMKLFSFLL